VGLKAGITDAGYQENFVSISVHSWLARLSPRKNPEKHEKR
jgi:hypothetical protein